MDIKDVKELNDKKVTLTSNNPVKMPKGFGGIMSKYYNHKIKKYEGKITEAETNINELNSVSSNIPDINNYAYNELQKEQEKQNKKLDGYETKLAKFYSLYEGKQNKVLGFNKSKVNKVYSEAFINYVEKANSFNDSSENPDFKQGQSLTTAPETNKTLVDTDLPPVENVDSQIKNTEVNNQPQETNSIESGDNVKKVVDIITEMQEESKKKDELIAKQQKLVEEYELEIENLKKQIEEFKNTQPAVNNTVEPVNVDFQQPAVNNTVEPVNVDFQQPVVNNTVVKENTQPFIQFVNKIQNATSTEQLDQIRNELAIARTQSTIKDFQFEILNNNIIKAYNNLQFQPVMDTPQPVPVDINQTEPQIDPQDFMNYFARLTNAVNDRNLSELLQLQGEVQFNKQKFAEVQFNYLINNIKNEINKLSQNQTGIQY